MHRAIITSSYHHSRVSYLHHDHAIAAAAGSTIGKFLERVRQDLLSQFPELQVRVCVCVRRLPVSMCAFASASCACVLRLLVRALQFHLLNAQCFTIFHAARVIGRSSLCERRFDPVAWAVVLRFDSHQGA